MLYANMSVQSFFIRICGRLYGNICTTQMIWRANVQKTKNIIILFIFFFSVVQWVLHILMGVLNHVLMTPLSLSSSTLIL